MKVRWTNQSIRFRITPTELALLTRGASIGSTLSVPGGAWTVAIEAGDLTSIAMDDNVLRVTLSAFDCDELAEPDREGVYFRADGENDIRYYIEKDFPCAHPRPPDAADPVTETFNPPAGFKLRHQTGCD